MTDREKFEDWFEEYTGWETDEYPNQDVVHACFEAWQAALASQQPADDGWIEWAGGDQPDITPKVQIKRMDGVIDDGYLTHFEWDHIGDDTDIISYRVVKP